MNKKIKSVCVYGVGGVGGYFGGRIAHEISKGNRAVQVYFIGRGEHLKSHSATRTESYYRQRGISLLSEYCDR